MAANATTVWDLQDRFDAAKTEAEQERIRQEIRDAGFNGVADTIGACELDDLPFPSPTKSD